MKYEHVPIFYFVYYCVHPRNISLTLKIIEIGTAKKGPADTSAHVQ